MRTNKIIIALCVLVFIFLIFVGKFFAFTYLKPIPDVEAVSKLADDINNPSNDLEAATNQSIASEKQSSSEFATEPDLFVVKECPKPEFFSTAQNNEDETVEDYFKHNHAAEKNLILAILSEDKPAKKFDVLSEIVNADPDNLLANWNLSALCTNSDLFELCNKSMDEIIARDKNNGALWLNVLSYSILVNDEASIINAFEQLIAAPYFNEYWSEHIELFAEGSSSDLTFAERYVSAIGSASAVAFPSLVEPDKYCRKLALKRADIAQLCLDAGKELETNGKTILSIAYGLSLQKAVFQEIKDEESLNQVASRKKQLLGYTDRLFSVRSNLIYHDERLMRDWLNMMMTQGELSAQRYLHDEIIRLSSDPDYDPCPKNG